ncbi:MAG: hypothetical protein HKN59_06715 [Gammaproteobacteria bacterium]|nr:hypothetical protein [Gammaproteobacteria bacterium]
MAGSLCGVLVSAVMTINDWRLNPGGIFHSQADTNWHIVAETALSWLLPVAAVSTAMVAAIIFLALLVTGQRKQK